MDANGGVGAPGMRFACFPKKAMKRGTDPIFPLFQLDNHES
jgi:hypothetical protein